MVKIVIDQGNSATKTGFFDQHTLIAFHSIPNDDKQQLLETIKKYKPKRGIISSVANKIDTDMIKSLIPEVIFLDENTKLPFINLYKSRASLGKDRIAAIAGAEEIYPKKNILVIDAGTAITYDLLLKNKQYHGGSISPGLEMRFKALNQFTSGLPLIIEYKGATFPGLTTAESIEAGVINGMIFEIEGYRKLCKEKWGRIYTIITGGNADFFARKLKKPIFVNQNIVLSGLNRILDYNA